MMLRMGLLVVIVFALGACTTEPEPEQNTLQKESVAAEQAEPKERNELTTNNETKWGADYFPNTILTDHNGKQWKFFDDLIEGKVVVINFIYTTCPDVCPLETAQLVGVSGVLGDRVGKDVHFLTITIDPEHDTPEVMKDYRRRYKANWPFYTGDKQEIINLRRKLGLYIEDLGGGENNHNVSLIIGNQTTGRWMKRTPFENPHVLADQIGNWLHGWKSPQKVKDFSKAPELRTLSDGESVFRTRCSSCHTIDRSDDSDAIGPDLYGVTLRRDKGWLISWLRNPEKMINEKDPIALELYERFNKVMMPDMGLGEADVSDLLQYMHAETTKSLHAKSIIGKDRSAPSMAPMETPSLEGTDMVAVMSAYVRQAESHVTENAGYFTLYNISEEDIRIIAINSPDFKKIEVRKSLKDSDKNKVVRRLIVPAGGSLKLSPDSEFLRMVGAKKSLKHGNTVDIKLLFANGAWQAVTLPVIKQEEI